MRNRLSIVAGLVLVAVGLWQTFTRERNAPSPPASMTVAAAPDAGPRTGDAAGATAANAAAKPAPSPAIAAEFIADGLLLSGTLPTAASHDRLLSRARELYGAEEVIDRIVVDESLPAAQWLETDALFLVLPTRGATRTAFDGHTLTLAGSLPRISLAAQIASEVAQQAGDGIQVDNRLEMRTPTTAEAQINEILRARNIDFAPNSNIFTPGSRQRLRRIAEVLRANTQTRFLVSGHTDSSGGATVSLALSETRAQAVVQFLTEQGLSPGRFIARGFGATRPVADNDSAQNRQRNRRIEFLQLNGVSS